MKHPGYRRSIQLGWTLLLAFLLLAMTVTLPVHASQMSAQRSTRHLAATSLTATTYLTLAALRPIFQSHIDQQVPTTLHNAIGNLVSTLPAANRGWATQMATTILQPSATLTQLTPQQDGLVTTLSLNLYDGDPQPIESSMLTTFGVVDPSTIQVSAQSLDGNPALVTGPLTTLHLVTAQASSVNTTPGCGDAALAVHVQLPMGVGQAANATTQTQQFLPFPAQTNIEQLSTMQMPRAPLADPLQAYSEVSATSLAALGGNFGSLPINSVLSAQNIQLSVQNPNLVVTSDVKLGPVTVATATTLMQPIANNGNLAMHVEKTDVKILGFLNFPLNTYNQQIQQAVNAKLNGSMTNTFTVTNAAIGPNDQVPCVANDSLLLTGFANVG